MLVFVVTLTTALAAGPVTLAAPEFNTLNVSADTARFCSEHLAQQFVARGVQVTTARQIAALLGMERQKQLLGCTSEGTSCMAELSAALGADGVILGDLGRLGKKYQINIKVLRAQNAEVVATWARAVGSEDDLLESLSDAAAELTPKIDQAFHRKAVAAAAAAKAGPGPAIEVPAAAPMLRTWPLVPTIVAGGLAVAGGVCFGLAASAHSQLTDSTRPAGSMSPDVANSLENQGNALQWASRIAFAGAGAAAITAGILYFTSGKSPVTAGVTVSPGSGSASLQGRF